MTTRTIVEFANRTTGETTTVEFRDPGAYPGKPNQWAVLLAGKLKRFTCAGYAANYAAKVSRELESTGYMETRRITV